MLRLFVGIALPPELRLALSLLEGGLPGARWVDPGNYHITLRFIGEVDEGAAGDVDLALAQLRARLVAGADDPGASDDAAQFDVVLATNMYGDILSDEAAGLVGGRWE